MHSLWQEPRVEQILWDVAWEHLYEAEFLWENWERALNAANLTPIEVAKRAEERLLAHIDALVLGGEPVRNRILIPTLDDDRRGAVCAAALALLLSGQSKVVQEHIASADDIELPAICRAIGVCPDPSTAQWLKVQIEGGKVAEQRLAPMTDALCSQAITLVPEVVRQCFDSEDPSLQRAAAKAAVFVETPQTVIKHLEAAFTSESAEVRDAALISGALLQLESSYEASREAISEGIFSPAASLLLATRSAEHANLFKAAQTPSSETRLAALWALAYVGTVTAANICIEASSSEEFLSVALNSFYEITGCSLDNRGTVDRSDAVEWWQEHGRRFEESEMYCRGKLVRETSLAYRLSQSRMHRLWDRLVVEQLVQGGKPLRVGLIQLLLATIGNEVSHGKG